MKNYLFTFLTLFLFLSCLSAQQLGELFQADQYDFHRGVDSIVSVKYMLNEYADDEPDFNFSYDGKELALHSFEQTVLVYADALNSESTTIQNDTSLFEVKNLTFNEAGQPVYMKSMKPSAKMFDEEKFYTYDAMGRLILQVRTGYNVMEYEQGNTDIVTDTTMRMTYGENNLVESAQFSMAIGMAMKVESENVGDTIQYMGEMLMTGMMAEQMPGKKKMTKKLMDLVINSETGNYEAVEKQRGGTLVKQIIDPSGKTIEKITSSGDEIMGHEKYGYTHGTLSSLEVVVGEEAEVEFNAAGQKISEKTIRGLHKFEYDEKGNLVQQVSLNPYSLEFQEMVVHKIYYK